METFRPSFLHFYHIDNSVKHLYRKPAVICITAYVMFLLSFLKLTALWKLSVFSQSYLQWKKFFILKVYLRKNNEAVSIDCFTCVIVDIYLTSRIIYYFILRFCLVLYVRAFYSPWVDFADGCLLLLALTFSVGLGRSLVWRWLSLTSSAIFSEYHLRCNIQLSWNSFFLLYNLFKSQVF